MTFVPEPQHTNWRHAITHDPELSELARIVALAADDARPVGVIDAAGLAAQHHATEKDIWLSVDELLSIGYVRLFANGHIYLCWGNDRMKRRARRIAHQTGEPLPTQWRISNDRNNSA